MAEGTRPVGLSLALVFATLVGGLAIRFASLGLPHWAVKYGGSALWALAIYWVVSSLLPRSIRYEALLAAVLASAVEVFKLYQSPSLDAFRRTLPGVLLLGRFFSVWDIAVYLGAILLGAALDGYLRRRIASSTE